MTEKNKLTNIILIAPEEYVQMIHNARQLTKGGSEPTVKELQIAMYEYYRARRTTRDRDRNHEISLYARDDSDGESTSSKKKSNKWMSKRNNGNANKKKETRECYGCGKKGHIK